MDQLIQDIRRRCRMQMNGIASTSMRQKGLNYKLNFGVSIPQIKKLASRYTPNSQLAQTLWDDTTRELKILATLLYPIQEYKQEVADKWVQQVPNQEIREQLVFNLLQNLADAPTLGKLWANSPNEEIRATGYWLLARLVLTNKIDHSLNTDQYTFAYHDIRTPNITLRNATILFLKNVGRLSNSLADTILDKLAFLQSSDNPTDKEVYQALSFEYNYLYNS